MFLLLPILVFSFCFFGHVVIVASFFLLSIARYTAAVATPIVGEKGTHPERSLSHLGFDGHPKPPVKTRAGPLAQAPLAGGGL